MKSSSGSRHFGKDSRVASFVRDEDRALRVAKELVDSGAYYVDASLSEQNFYTWKSGIRAPCYCNCRELLSGATSRRVVSTELSGAIRERFTEIHAVVGIATAGIAWAAMVADQLDTSFAYVRAEKKIHGIGGLVQGRLPHEGNVVLIDDLVASGGSLLSAINAIESETSSKVVGVQTIVNWGFDRMHHELKTKAYNALTSYPHILTAAMMKGALTPTDMQRFLDFYEDPSRGFAK